MEPACPAVIILDCFGGSISVFGLACRMARERWTTWSDVYSLYKRSKILLDFLTEQHALEYPKGPRRSARVYLTLRNTVEGVQAQAHSAATAATSTRKTEPGSIRYPRASRQYYYKDYYVRGERYVSEPVQ